VATSTLPLFDSVITRSQVPGRKAMLVMLPPSGLRMMVLT